MKKYFIPKISLCCKMGGVDWMKTSTYVLGVCKASQTSQSSSMAESKGNICLAMLSLFTPTIVTN